MPSNAVPMFLSDLKNALASGLGKARELLFLDENKALESLPEPYIPSYDDTLAEMPTTLREKALGTLGGANPSQLGDPISLKAEQSDTIPTPDEAGAGSASSYSASSRLDDGGYATRETIRGRAAKESHGPDANPTQLGDPVSMRTEQTHRSEEGGARRRDSKL